MTAVSTDDLEDPLKYDVQIHTSTAGDAASLKTSLRDCHRREPRTPSGKQASCTGSVALTNGTTYYRRARATNAAGISSAWSTLTPFTVDTSKPAAPALTSTYPNGQWAVATDAQGLAHVTASTSDADARSINWSINDQEFTKTTARVGAGTADLSFTPQAGSSRYVIYARAIDRAGNIGPTSSLHRPARHRPLRGTGGQHHRDAERPQRPRSVRSRHQPHTRDSGRRRAHRRGCDLRLRGLLLHVVDAHCLLLNCSRGEHRASWTLPAGALTPGRSYNYRVRVRDATHTSPWTQGRTVTIDVPTSVTELRSAPGPEGLLISARSGRPSQHAIDMRFFLWDGAGTALNGAHRSSRRAPTMTSQATITPAIAALGSSIQWAAQACVPSTAICSAVTARKSATNQSASFTTQTVTIPRSALSLASASVDPADCASGSCALQSSAVRLGGSNYVFVKANAASLVPVDAEIVEATANLAGLSLQSVVRDARRECDAGFRQLGDQ
ncbi:hypothetical protein GCM10025868_46680 [Angustibacter aerolatus]|uniref:Fibronectin type-III domain-containing protein n=1 Tax=Angustibacter aerolatus TaxID=1162965 RepID=A0ABQ6JPV6_9ACTN|nr:hypothetical protein [Angustibacter aerolatus]GMA89418.1 hypothetical protein GCM10025868_46680 [Angustibacter aerolatus]